MSKSQVYVVLDDEGGRAPGIQFGGGQWTVGNIDKNYWFLGTTSWPGFQNQGRSGFMTFAFEGVGFSVWGNTPGSADSQEFQVSIDDSGPYTSSTSDPTPQTWMQWYQSPTLNSGRHGVNISSLYGEAVDLIAITPGPDTPLSGRTLIVDDGHPSIKYEGKGWKEEGGRYRQGGGVGFVPFQNSTHNTETVGDSFTFTFSGTNLKVYGLMVGPALGGVALNWSIDQGERIKKHWNSGDRDRDYAHLPFIDTGALSAREHTINVVLESTTLTHRFMLDYMLYTPSFATLGAIPGDSSGNPPSSPSGTTSSPNVDGNPASSGVVGTAGGPLPSEGSPAQSGSRPQSADPSPSGNPVPVSDDHSQTNKQNPSFATSKPSTGAIAGGVVGGIGVLTIILAFLIFWRRKQQRSTTLNMIEAYHADTSPSYTGDASATTGSTFTVGHRPILPPAEQGSPASSSQSSSSIPYSKRVEREEIRRRMEERQAGTRAPAPSTSEMQRRIQELSAENARLVENARMAVGLASAPPAYEPGEHPPASLRLDQKGDS